MGILILLLLVIGLCAWFISRSVYKKQVKNDYKNPGVTAVIVFILTFSILAVGIFLLIAFNIRIER